MRHKNKKKSDTTILKAFLERSLNTEKSRTPLRCTLRLINILSAGRLGIPRGGGWKNVDAFDSGTDQRLLFDILWCDYWQGLPAVAGLYESELEFFEEPEQLVANIVKDKLPTIQYEPPVYLLPAPSGPEYIPEPEPEIIDVEPLPVIDEEALALEAEETANQALSVFQGDNVLWERPESLLEGIEKTLVSVSTHHPDKLSLFERVTFVRECFHHLSEFEDDFTRVMNTPHQPDEAWTAPWLAKASIDLQQQSLMPTPDSLKRASLPHYLIERWNSLKANGGFSKDDTNMDSGVHPSDPPIQSFRGPATSKDSCF